VGSRSGFAENGGGRQRRTQAREDRLATNKVVQTISLDENVAPKRSYLNDLRLDTKTGHAFITESGTGAIIVVDLKSGKARRLLANNPSTKLEPEAEIVVDGMKIIDPETGNAPAFQAELP
jgi:Major royal jelly protein